MRFLFVVFLLAACGNDNTNNLIIDAGNDVQDEDITPYPTVSFKEEIAPIFRNSCILSGCHGENGVSKFLVPEGLDASDSEIEKGLKTIRASNGTLLIDPRKPSKSEIIIRIFAEENSMPPLTVLPVEQKNDLNFWIAQGAKYQ